MLDIKSATIIKNAINEKLGVEISTLEDVCRMQPLPVANKSCGYIVLGMQYGNLAILVWVQLSESSGIIVHKVYDQPL